ncbi:MAG: ATP-binding protein [Chloroflexota bacterium]|nr:ATP-binding protein [Chloroflexota bacterium]
MPVPTPVPHPVLVVLCGLPGAGKSYCASWLAQRAPLYVVESDHLRRLLFREPTHSPEESARLFRACHSLVEALLREGTAVIFDATNLLEAHRAYLYQIAERVGAGLVLVYLTASAEVVFRRLQARLLERGQNSSADWEVYQRMRSSVEPIRRRHLSINTDGDVEPDLTRVLEELRRHIRGQA